MENSYKSSEESDEISKLEKLQLIMNREREAWKKLLDNLEYLRIKNTK